MTGTLPAASLAGTYGGAVNFSNVNNTFAGDGGGLTNLNTTNLVGTVADARLSANVALRAGGNTFNGTQIFNNAVGIGTTAPSQKLHVADGRLRVSDNSLSGVIELAGGSNTIYLFTDATDGGFYARTDATDRHVILQGGGPPQGNVGIGTTTPSTKLQVAGTVTATSFVGDGAGLTNLPGGGGFSWQVVSGTAQQAQPNTGYVANNASEVTITLPTAPSVGSIVRVTDSGANWTPRDSARPWREVASSADGTKLAAVTQNGQIYTSTDSGTNWTPRESVRYWEGIASSADGTKLAAVAASGLIYTSTDSGENWIPRESSRNWVSIASSADGTKLAAAVANGLIYTSTDSGVNWFTVQSSREWRSIASSADGGRLFAVVYGGPFYTTFGVPIPATRTTTSGAAGYLTGAQTTAVELQYIGGGQFMPISYVGTFSIY